MNPYPEHHYNLTQKDRKTKAQKQILQIISIKIKTDISGNRIGNNIKKQKYKKTNTGVQAEHITSKYNKDQSRSKLSGHSSVNN
ncbi:MAG: hypothetical protein WCQ47_05030 [bacterium]